MVVVQLPVGQGKVVVQLCLLVVGVLLLVLVVDMLVMFASDPTIH